MTKRNNKKTLISVIGTLVLIGAVLGYARFSNNERQETVATKAVTEVEETSATQLARKERGPRPENKHLRDGAEQIEERGEAIQLARDSLTRVDKEIAGARDDKAKIALERKKELIEQAMAKLSNIQGEVSE